MANVVFHAMTRVSFQPSCEFPELAVANSSARLDAQDCLKFLLDLKSLFFLST